ncbi:uncharacterized protein VSU04_005765 isoform 3-T5 [Chlamydotis macqueenii]
MRCDDTHSEKNSCVRWTQVCTLPSIVSTAVAMSGCLRKMNLKVTTEINRELFNTEVEEKAEKRGEQLLENWKSSALKKGAGFPETEVTLGAQGVLGQTACLLRQSQTLLLKVKEISASKMHACLS